MGALIPQSLANTAWALLAASMFHHMGIHFMWCGVGAGVGAARRSGNATAGADAAALEDTYVV